MSMHDFMEMRDDYRMPVAFAPADMPVTTYWDMALSVNVKFETDGALLQKLLPPMLVPAANEVPVYQNKYINVNFMAGRGYNFFGVSIPAKYEKNGETIQGSYLPVCWMNDAFAILFGREGAGYPKLYADMTDPVLTDTGYRCFCSEYGHKLIELEVSDLVQVPSEQVTKDVLNGNLFLHKSIRGFGDVKEVDYVTVGGNQSTLSSFAYGKGTCTFFDATWQQAPCSYNVMRGLRELPMLGWKGATVTTGSLWSKGGGMGRTILK